MKSAGTLIIAVTLLVSASAWAQDAAASGSPYASIISRNMFGLVPIPTNNPEDNKPPAEPPPKITPNGIMTIFGRLQALFKVANKGKPGQPVRDDSYVLAEGERQDDIEILKINQPDGIVTFNNHGTVQELPLVVAKDATSAAGPGGPGGPGAGFNPGMRPSGSMTPAEHAAMMRRQPGKSMGGMPNPGDNAGSPNFNSGGGGVPNQSQNAKDVNVLSPEAQVLLIEAQRMQAMQEGNPIANILPPTPFTEQNVREGGGLPPIPNHGTPTVP
jgi:hypothetical protein